MPDAHILRHDTDKPLSQFVADLAAAARDKGFLIHNEDKMEMSHTFGRHGVEVAEGFDLHMIQICNPGKAAASMQRNPERAPLIPKFIIAFTRDGKTCVRMLRISSGLTAALLDDEDFPASLEQSYDTIEDIIQRAC
jgi:uncharacterized protein (DUF302 family)